MYLPVGIRYETLAAILASVRPVPCMGPYVVPVRGIVPVPLPAELTDEGLLPGVRHHVSVQERPRHEGLGTQVAVVRPLLLVDLQVD